MNDGCIGCGLSASACPEVFSLMDEGTAIAIDTVVPASAVESAAEAKSNCPAEAIKEA